MLGAGHDFVPMPRMNGYATNWAALMFMPERSRRKLRMSFMLWVRSVRGD